MEDLEHRTPEPETAAPPPELQKPAAEFPAPPPEYGQSSGPAVTVPPRRRLRKWLLGLAAAALAGFLCFHTGAVKLPAQQSPEPTPSMPAEMPGTLPSATETPEPTATPEPTPAPTPEPTPEPIPTWPLEGDSEMLIVVFNNDWTYDSEEGWGPQILLQEVVPESEFNDMELPAPVIGATDPEDWSFAFAGYVLHYNSMTDVNYDPASEIESFVVPLEGNVLTRADVERVPRHSDGHRYVFVHVVWRSIEPEKYEGWEFKLKLILDDGLGNETVWEGSTPFASEGCTYLSAYPVPEREGYTFTGWYDADGNRVDFLTYFDFYENKRLVESGGGYYLDADWDKPVAVRLTAGWEKQ